MDQRDFKDEFAQSLHDKIHEEIHERIKNRVNRPRVMLAGDVHWGFAWGLVIFLGGVGLLLYQMGVIPFNPVSRFWPLLLVLFGVMNLMTQSGRFFGFLLILAGVFLELNKLGLTHLTLGELWPLALIALGLLLMWGALQSRASGGRWPWQKQFENFRQQVADATNAPAGMLNAIAVFGGCERRVSSKNFQRGKVTAVFGGVELDFRDADIENESGEAMLEINCIFGGVEVRVPENWHVHSRSIPVFGGYEDTSRQPADPPGAKPKTLVVTGMVLFGGVEIKN